MTGSRRGLFLPPFDPFADPARVGDLAARAEEAGWDGVFVWDHLRYREPVAAIADPWVCCAAIAARTQRLLFGPMVTPLPRRRPHVVARAAASLATMSGGRLVLGFGIGDDTGGEFGAFGDERDARVRGAMLDEGLDVLTALLGGEPVRHEGPYYLADDVRFLPAPEHPIPIWIAGRHGNAAPLRRAARYDGAFVIGIPGPDALDDVRGPIAERRGSLEGYDVVVDLPVGEDPAPWAAAGASWVLTRVGPYRMDADAVLAVVDAGP